MFPVCYYAKSVVSEVLIGFSCSSRSGFTFFSILFKAGISYSSVSQVFAPGASSVSSYNFYGAHWSSLCSTGCNYALRVASACSEG